jgi:type II secretory pathway pseudopilin PulG
MTSARRAFTILELVVVIGIILLLAALTVAVAVGVTSKSEARETQNALKLLDLAVGEWEVAADRKPTIGDGDRYDVETTGPGPGEDIEEHWVHDLLELLDRQPSSQGILAQVNPDFLVREQDADGEMVLKMVDAWDKHVWLILPYANDPALPDGSVTDLDADGTARLLIESQLGVCVARRICFVSAGPDGLFGDLTEPDGSPLREAVEDNVYSHEVIRP